MYLFAGACGVRADRKCSVSVRRKRTGEADSVLNRRRLSHPRNRPVGGVASVSGPIRNPSDSPCVPRKYLSDRRLRSEAERLFSDAAPSLPVLCSGPEHRDRSPVVQQERPGSYETSKQLSCQSGEERPLRGDWASCPFLIAGLAQLRKYLAEVLAIKYTLEPITR